MSEDLANKELQDIRNMSDEDLVFRICNKGEEHLFSIIFERYNEKIFKRCRSIIKNENEARDLSQDIFVKLFGKIRNFKNQSKLATWIYSITYNECISFLRKNNHKMIKVQLEEIIDNIQLANYPEDEDLDFMVDEVSIDMAESFINLLPAADKLVLTLKYYEKMPIKKIMELLSLSESAVKMRIKRAKIKLSKILELDKNTQL